MFILTWSGMWNQIRAPYKIPVVLTCAFELTSPHAFSRSSTLGAVRSLTAGLCAVAGQEYLSLVDPTVMFRGTANRAADTGPLWTVCAPLTL